MIFKVNTKDFSQISQQEKRQKKYILLQFSQQKNNDVIQLNKTSHHSGQFQISNQIKFLTNFCISNLNKNHLFRILFNSANKERTY
jgi:recombinational DNA repair protein RecR